MASYRPTMRTLTKPEFVIQAMLYREHNFIGRCHSGHELLRSAGAERAWAMGWSSMVARHTDAAMDPAAGHAPAELHGALH